MIIKKLPLIIIFLLAALNTFAQDTAYHKYIDTINHQDSGSYQVILRDPADTNKATVKEYYSSGQLMSEAYYVDYKKYVIQGKYTEYYPDGELRQVIDYTNGLPDGRILTYWKNGQAKRIDSFRNGEFITGKCFTQDGKATAHTDFLQIPEFPGGIPALMRFLSKAIKYPKRAKKEGIEGKVTVQFIVNTEGYIREATVTGGVTDDLDNEALRVVNLMPKWKPGVIDDEPANIQFTLPIHFMLNGTTHWNKRPGL